jgi:hypothetical protein
MKEGFVAIRIITFAGSGVVLVAYVHCFAIVDDILRGQEKNFKKNISRMFSVNVVTKASFEYQNLLKIKKIIPSPGKPKILSAALNVLISFQIYHYCYECSGKY